MSFTIARPAAGEFAEYYKDYIAKVPEGDVLAFLEKQRAELVAAFHAIPEERGTYRYQPGKWSISDVITHVIDAERIFSVRALRIARGDKTPQPGWDENDYAAMAGGDGRTPQELADEFDAVRRSTIALFKSFDPEAVVRSGVANNFEITVRAIVYVVAGHAAHHVQVLRERYKVA